MDALYPLFLSGATGLVSGLLLSIPVGPINLTILNEGARRGFKWGLLIGLGATTMEAIYCFIAFTGFASFLNHGVIKNVMELISFVFLLYLGIKFLLAKSAAPTVHPGPGHHLGTRIEERFNPQSAFMTGLVRVMGNVGVLIFWIVLATNFIYRGLVVPDWPNKCLCVAGVTLGTGGWFAVLSRLAALGRGKLSDRTLLRIERGSGIILLILAFVHGGIVLWHMRRA